MAKAVRANARHIAARIAEAIDVLKELGLPREQQNARSALTLLALLDLHPQAPWSTAQRPLLGITGMMDWFTANYRKTYAPNSRETVRRYTVHQFVAAGLAVANPDAPGRPINSPDNVYQISEPAHSLLRNVGTLEWDLALKTWLLKAGSLRERYAHDRQMRLIPVRLPSDTRIELSPGGQNPLIQAIIEQFCSRFTPDAQVLYVGDTGDKFVHYERERLAGLGVRIDDHGKMPDIVVHHRSRNWLVLVEAVTSHGPMNPKRRAELRALFAASTAGLVFVSAFKTRAAMVRHLAAIAWETEVWIAEEPSHLIHFNGERFLGPYPG